MLDLAPQPIEIAAPAADAPAAPQEGKGDTQWPARTWEMPALSIKGQPVSELREEDRIGSYGQPRWTSHRRFAASRVYVRPEGEIDMEFWGIAKIPKHGPTKYFTQTEVEIGLPHRFQLDVYGITRHEEGSHETHEDLALEVRYALADWGEIWGNPALYLEYKFQDSASDVVESKLLLGDEFCPRWHWATNFIWEQETTEARESVLEMTNGISYTLLDEKLSIGAEAKSEIANEAGGRSQWEENVRVGPSFQYRPVPRMHIDFAPLFGVTESSRRCDVFLIFGWEF